MTDFNTDLTKALLAQRDLNDFFREQLEFSMKQLLQAELSSVLGYKPYERFGGRNARNGTYFRSFDTCYGKLNLTIPRDAVAKESIQAGKKFWPIKSHLQKA